jgi:hypothetical protein
VRAADGKGEDAVLFLADREADRFGDARARQFRADDLGPAADDRRLDEAESPERRAGSVLPFTRFVAGLGVADLGTETGGLLICEPMP